MKKIITFTKAVSVLALAVLILVFSYETSQSVIRSIDVCITSVIPSMFALMVLSSHLISSGMYKLLFSPLLFVLRKIIKTDDCTLSVFLLSLIGGYPVGLKLLSEINTYNKNYYEISSKAATFCYCVSPSFAIIMLGIGVFGNAAAGVLIYASNVLACFTAAVFVTRTNRMTADTELRKEPEGIISAVNSTVSSLTVICAVIVCFNIVLTCIRCVLSVFGIPLAPEAAGIAEITNLLNMRAVSVSSIPFVSAVSSFGGVCVLVQCAAIAKNRTALSKFLAARIPCALLSAAISYILLNFFDISVAASAVSGDYSFEFNANKAVVVLMLMMCVFTFMKSERLPGRKSDT